MSLLSIQAGARALKHIQREGLQPHHIGSIFGASGAAKWLAIYGLDRAIFSQWLSPERLTQAQTIKLFGTSVGAFKLAAACHQDAAAGLDALSQAYIHQSFPEGVGADEIAREFVTVQAAVVGDNKIEQILNHPFLRFSCGAVRCHGGLASKNIKQQAASCAKASVKNLKGRNALADKLDRIVFHDPRQPFDLTARDGYCTETVALSADNLQPALTASGSIPVYMHGVEDIAGAGEGMYRDGGLLDYHPVPGNFWNSDELILYPHFFPHCKVGWFDKYLPWRKADPDLLDNALLISPSQEFWQQTELGRAPDRKDFVTYQKNDAERVRLWQQVADLSHALGEEFLTLSQTEDWSQVQPLR
ncbi:MAG: hypothetical protein CL693_06255 [Cellvibrionaceae bacterium]|nr:hypothetical protein [Cellvibrionaceae bacterium]|tara:strand:- start:12304 stop:13383 length:1080 start_codon:yes stop_codon:yes gene_type:complete